MRKSIFALLTFCLLTTALVGQETIVVKLDEDTPCLSNYALKYANANISVCSEKTNNDDIYNISMKLENTDESLNLIIFGHGWSKKELRGFRILDETSNDPKSHIDHYPDIKYDMRMDPSDNFDMPIFSISNGQEHICRIPFYIAKERKRFLCKKTVLLEKQIIDLHITVDVKKDKDYPILKQECDSLYEAYNEALESHRFCSNPLHRPSLQEQTKVFLEQRDDLRLSIDLKLAENKWDIGSKQYTLYKELLNKLDEINPDNIDYDCGIKEMHVRVHSCSYCDLSLADIYHRLEAYYITLTQGDKTKAEVWNDVNKLYTCYTKSSKNASRKKEGKVVKDGIVKYYNLIKKKQ